MFNFFFIFQIGSTEGKFPCNKLEKVIVNINILFAKLFRHAIIRAVDYRNMSV